MLELPGLAIGLCGERLGQDRQGAAGGKLDRGPEAAVQVEICAEGRKRAGIQVHLRAGLPAWIPAHDVGLDACESLWYAGACREGHGGSFLWAGGAQTWQGERLSACVAGVSIGQVFWQGKRGEEGGQMMERLIEGPLWAWVWENGPWLLAGVLVLVVVCVPWWECMRIDESERGREEEVEDEQRLA